MVDNNSEALRVVDGKYALSGEGPKEIIWLSLKLTPQNEMVVDAARVKLPQPFNAGEFKTAVEEAVIAARSPKIANPNLIGEALSGGTTAVESGKKAPTHMDPWIYTPTFLIVTTMFNNAHFTGQGVRQKDTATPLDKYCRSPRLWDQDRVFGWYSSFDKGKTSPVELSQHDFTLEWRGWQKHSDGKLVHKATPFIIDPGNNNGGGNGFP